MSSREYSLVLLMQLYLKNNAHPKGFLFPRQDNLSFFSFLSRLLDWLRLQLHVNMRHEYSLNMWFKETTNPYFKSSRDLFRFVLCQSAKVRSAVMCVFFQLLLTYTNCRFVNESAYSFPFCISFAHHSSEETRFFVLKFLWNQKLNSLNVCAVHSNRYSV